MKNTIISLLCEGPHDVAFLSKVLKTNGFKSNESSKLKDYPQPISDLIINETKKTNVNELNIQEVRSSLIPSSTLKKDSIYLFLYSLGGDTKRENRINFLKDLITLIPAEGEFTPYPDFELGLIYFFDSDDKGISSRVQSINSEIESIIGSKPFTDHEQVSIIENVKVGCFIFTKSDEDLGKLEDIILPLMRENNEVIFDQASHYIDTHFVSKRCSGRFDKSKSTIGISGQLQKSGSSNVVCIAATDYLTPEKISTNTTCNKIIAFVNKFISIES